jgi:hypothetical protein
MQLFIFISQAMNVFVNLFGRASKFSVKDGKSNLRGWSLTDRSSHASFHFIHLDFLWKEGKKERKKERRKIGGSCQKSAASGGNHLPYLLGNSKGFPMSTCDSPLSRTNVQNSGQPPSDEQMQFISKQYNIFGLISHYWVQSCVSLRIGRECDQDH